MRIQGSIQIRGTKTASRCVADSCGAFDIRTLGVVYEQNLAEQTTDTASKITDYNLDSSWRPALE